MKDILSQTHEKDGPYSLSLCLSLFLSLALSLSLSLPFSLFHFFFLGCVFIGLDWLFVLVASAVFLLVLIGFLLVLAVSLC